MPSKHAQEVIISRKSKKLTHPPLISNSNNASKNFSQKYLGVILDFKLTFQDHLNNVLANLNNRIGLLRKLQTLLSRKTLITRYKAFTRPHLNYGVVLHYQVPLGSTLV